MLHIFSIYYFNTFVHFLQYKNAVFDIYISKSLFYNSNGNKIFAKEQM